MWESLLRGRGVTALLVLMLLTGFGLMAYPSVSDWWNTLHASRVVEHYNEIVGHLSRDETQDLLAAAHDYNHSLTQEPDRYAMDEAALERYTSLLDVDGSGTMGYVQIPCLGLLAPVGHGTQDSVLQHAIGHLEGTSLPVGGPATHTVIIGHRGLPSAKLFTDIDRLTKGDLFYLNVLDQTMAYEVDAVYTVLPDDYSRFEIRPEQDLCTLVTCTPYGINTHRLLVRGHRVDKGQDAHVHAEAAFVDQRLVALALVALVVVVATCAIGIRLLVIKR